MMDAHQHFWQPARGDYEWPNDSVEPVFNDFGPGDLEPLTFVADGAQTNLLQATPTVADTEYLLQLGASRGSVADVVGWVDLSAPVAVETIDRLAADPMFKGPCPMLQSIADIDRILRPTADPTLRRMPARGPRFDAPIQPYHLGILSTHARTSYGLASP